VHSYVMKLQKYQPWPFKSEY